MDQGLLTTEVTEAQRNPERDCHRTGTHRYRVQAGVRCGDSFSHEKRLHSVAHEGGWSVFTVTVKLGR